MSEPVGSVPFLGFRATEFRTGNSLDGYRKAEKKGVRFAESDFRLTADGHLVSSHDDRMGGNCGRASKKTLKELKNCKLNGGSRVGTLRDFLALPLTEWFIDLKDTQSNDQQKVMKTVEAAIKDVKSLGRRDRAVLMVYTTKPSVVDLIKKSGVRAGIKGYPKNREQTMKMVRRASKAGYEMACFHISQVTTEVLDLSARMNVWHLAWDLSGPPSVWAERAAFGLGGVITRDVSLARRTVGDSWRRAEGFKSSGEK